MLTRTHTQYTSMRGDEKCRLGAQHTCSEEAAAAEAGAGAAGVEEMAVTKEGMACASSSLGRHAPGPAHTHVHAYTP